MRVALFSDSFAEANGVATVSRQFVSYARRNGAALLAVHSGAKTQITDDESVTTLELRRGLASFRLDHDLYCDPLLSRYRNLVFDELQEFQPDLIQITGPGDMGILGLWMAYLFKVPLVASWHTNLHEYAGRRLDSALSFLPDSWRKKVAGLAQSQSLRACMWFYHYAKFTMAPNRAMVNMLAQRTGHPSFPMAHGVDTNLFSPSRRDYLRSHRDNRNAPFRIGYVGRLTPEKNVRLLADLEKTLVQNGHSNFRIVLVGEGSDREWLRKHLQFGEFPGVLRGPALADAFAGMDAFVFPSRTDTFGLVVLEAMASGVPVVTSPETATRVGIADGVTGFHAASVNEFADCVMRLIDDRAMRQHIVAAARSFSLSRSWDTVFDQVYRTYEDGLEMIGRRRRSLVEVPVA